MGFQVLVMFIGSFMDDVTDVWHVGIQGPREDQKGAHSNINYCFMSLAEQRTCQSSQYTPYTCHHAGKDSSFSTATRYGLDQRFSNCGPRVLPLWSF